MVCLMFVESKAVVYPNLTAGGLRKLALCGDNEALFATFNLSIICIFVIVIILYFDKFQFEFSFI
jgi:hypothetical protein